MPHERTLSEILLNFGDQLKNDLKKCVPATVTAVYPSRQTVDVVVATLGVVFDELGTAIQEPPVSFSDVPLGCLRGGGFVVWLPVTVGDGVLLVFSDLSADSWRSGNGQPTPPGWVGKHTTDSPFALPMFQYDSAMFASPGSDPSKIIIGKDGGTAQIKISASDIELGGSSAAVALSTKIDSLINLLVATPYTPTLVGLGTFFSALTSWQMANWPVSSTTGSATAKSA